MQYDEFTVDSEENRLLKAASARLRRLRLRSAAVQHGLRSFDLLLDPVRLVHYAPTHLPEIHYTRLNEHYRPAVELAKLILRATVFELRHGSITALAFLVDMNQIFEDFVVQALRDALGLSARAFTQGARGKRLVLDGAGRIRLYPDFSWWHGSRYLALGDVKHKRLQGADFLHADLYQLLSYTIAADVPGGVLVYAAGEIEAAAHEIVSLGKTLHVLTLDLAGAPEQILARIDEIAAQVRRLYADALASVAVGVG